MNHKKFAYFSLRLGFAFNLFLHGLMRFGNEWSYFQDWLIRLFSESPLPGPLVSVAGFILPPLYFILGLLLMAGLFTRWVLMSCCLLFIVLLTGSGLVEQWNMVALQMSYLFISALLLFFVEYDEVALDRIIGQRAHSSHQTS